MDAVVRARLCRPATIVLCLDRTDDCSEAGDGIGDAEAGSRNAGSKYSIVSSNSRGGICGQLRSDTDEGHLTVGRLARCNDKVDNDRMELLVRS